MTEKPAATIDLKGRMNPQTLGAIIIALQGAYRITFAALAEQHGNVPGPWLDELEGAILRDAKGIITENIAVQVEAPAIGAGVEVVEALMGSFRRGLTVKDGNEGP